VVDTDCHQELGIFDALKKNYLAALQLTIFENKINPSNVFEAYTFSFKYLGSAKDDSLRLAGMQLEHPAGKATVRDVKHGLQLVVRRLVQLSTILPKLPGNILKFLTSISDAH
jgi:meiosis-specific protein HOP1